MSLWQKEVRPFCSHFFSRKKFLNQLHRIGELEHRRTLDVAVNVFQIREHLVLHRYHQPLVAPKLIGWT